MKTTALKAMMLIPMVLFLGCKGQTNKGTKQTTGDTTVYVAPTHGKDSVIAPQVKVRVNRKYGDNGKLESYDSTYTYSYTGPAGNMMSSKEDSVFGHFKSFFQKNYPGFLNPQYDNIFYNDSLFRYDFFNSDYFRKRYELNNQMFEGMFRRMDSLKNQYMKDNYPNGAQQKK